MLVYQEYARKLIARDGLEQIVHYLMNISVLILYPRVISIYQIYTSPLKTEYKSG